MMEQDLGTKNNRLFSILGPLFMEKLPVIFTVILGKLCVQALTGIRDTDHHSPFMTVVVAQLVPRYCKGRHETK